MDVESLHFPTFSAKCCECKIEKRDGNGKIVCEVCVGYPLHRESRENGQNITMSQNVRENTGNLEILPKHTKLCLLKL